MNDINPVNYKIHLEPDLENFRFSGTVELLLEATQPVNEISLNILELAVWGCKLKKDGGFSDCAFSIYPEKEAVMIMLPGEMSGKITVKIDYMGLINDKMAGFYRSKYRSQGKSGYIAVTQFEESDARRAFPCLDHPVKKATFDIEMVLDEGLEAISNQPVSEEHSVPGGKKLVLFQQTPRMSTYLLFFGIGVFEMIEDPGDVTVRVFTMPQLTKYAKPGLDFGRKSLEFCEDSFGTKYPLQKLDLIAVQDFAFGAMENWGAITFRENLLLHYPDITSKAGEERIYEVIAHEIVHQWFGNLVTPSDWKYLWLNESFATYFGYGAVDHYHPEWDIWQQFLRNETDTALDRDALKETIPIEIPGGEHVIINSSTAPIIYNKGASVLRQIKDYIGENEFKDGLRHYLDKYKYDCTASHNLWESLDISSPIPVIRIMRGWIEQPGFPVVSVKREGSRLRLTQKRFSFLPSDSDRKWLVPINIRVFDSNGNSRCISTLLEDRHGSIEIGSNAVAYKINDRQTGFFRAKYNDNDNLNELGKRVWDLKLSPEDRWGVQNDLYALVRCGEITIDRYLDFLSNYSNETSFLPLVSIADNLFHAHLILEGTGGGKIASAGKSLLETILTRIGYEPGRQEKHTTAILRDQLIWQAALYGSKTAEEFALERFTALMNGEMIHPDIMKAIMQVGALNNHNDAFLWFVERTNSSKSEHERMNILIALGCFREKSMIEKSLQYLLDKVPSRNKFVMTGAMAANPYAVPYLWDWYRTQVRELEKFHPLHYERVITGIIPVCGIGREEEVNTFFAAYLEKTNNYRDAIKLALERLEINSRMKKGH